MEKRKLRLVAIALVLAIVLTLVLTSVASACPPCPCTGGYWYKVVRGDTWYGVARKTGIGAWTLMNANPRLIRWNKWLYVCDWMWIPKCCYATCCCW